MDDLKINSDKAIDGAATAIAQKIMATFMGAPKYELTDNVKTTSCGTTVHQIRALRQVGNVKPGDLGGFIQSEKNLSHEGFCWIDRGAMVFDSARVSGNAIVGGTVRVYGDVEILGNSIVVGHFCLFNNKVWA